MSWPAAKHLTQRGIAGLRRRVGDRLHPTIVGGPDDAARLSLTYDDGPTPGVTNLLGDRLAEAGHRATLFVLVPQAEACPALVRRLLDQGHEVALHGVRHVAMTKLSSAQVASDLRDGVERLSRLGAPPRFVRPPYGAQNRRTYGSTRAAGLKVVGWSHDVRDFDEPDLPTLAGRLDQALVPGAIVLMHDGDGDHPDRPYSDPQRDLRTGALAHALAVLAERGLRSVSVSELVDGASRTREWVA